MTNDRETILKRHPDWDGNIDTLFDLMTAREGPFFEIWYNDEKDKWAWLDVFFELSSGYKDSRDEAILVGAAHSCYWLDDYEQFLEREANAE